MCVVLRLCACVLLEKNLCFGIHTIDLNAVDLKLFPYIYSVCLKIKHPSVVYHFESNSGKSKAIFIEKEKENK